MFIPPIRARCFSHFNRHGILKTSYFVDARSGGGENRAIQTELAQTAKAAGFAFEYSK